MSGERESHRFGTFGGVFTPCTLTILGVIMFLRLGHVVGQAGMFWAIGIILTAKVITFLTSLSLSAIATNTRVKGGGAYYLISRSLGVGAGRKRRAVLLRDHGAPGGIAPPGGVRGQYRGDVPRHLRLLARRQVLTR